MRNKERTQYDYGTTALKGVKREQAILELGKEEANGELLLQLVNTEKGKCKNGCSKGFGATEV